MTRAPIIATTYPLDARLQGALDDALARGDAGAEASARLALDIRGHKRFPDLVQRMSGVSIPLTPRGLSRTSKTALIGQPEPETAFAKAYALARVIADDLVAEPERAGATALALVLAEECRRPATGRRLHAEQPAT